MAIRARLTAPPSEPEQDWPWHVAKWTSLPSHLIGSGDRRMEADSYLSSGFGLRASIEEKRGGWCPLRELANAGMPGRLAGVLVDPSYGTPYLAATQVFDTPPIPRKWLSLPKTADAETRFVEAGQILVTRSGSVGRAIIAHNVHEQTIISDDLIRVDPNKREYGWIYGFLRSPQALAMASGVKYGHVIKHLEPTHILSLPVPLIDDETADQFTKATLGILRLRNESHRLAAEANAAYSAALGDPQESPVEGYIVSAASLAGGRRRLEGAYHTPIAKAILRLFKQSEPLSALTEGVWWKTRFKRHYGDGGLPYLSADELFTTNPLRTKRILVRPDDSHEKYFVQRGWIVMACSGQVYGLNGAAALMTEHHERTFFSHDLIRIIPDLRKVRAGYLVVALTHPVLGRPLLIREAYGTSIPHLDPGDVARFPIARLGDHTESAIADLAERSAKARADADALDRQIAVDASEIIDRFIARSPVAIV